MDVRYRNPSRASRRAYEQRQDRRQRNQTAGAVVGGLLVAAGAVMAVLRSAGVGGPRGDGGPGRRTQQSGS